MSYNSRRINFLKQYLLYSLQAFIRLIQVLTLRKLWNLFVTYTSFYISRWTGKAWISHQPFTLSFEPTTQCNLGCPECPSGLKSFTRETGNAELSIYSKLLDDTSRDLLFLYLYFQGEPLIHKDFQAMIRMAKSKRIYTVTSTNGHYLTPRKSQEIIEAGLDRILISIDGATQEVYEQYRVGGDLSKALDGAKNLVEARKRLKTKYPEIIFQMLVVRPNENQIQEVEKIAREIGVDKLILKTAQVYDFENGNPLIPIQSQYSRYQKMSNGKWKLKNELKNQCWKMWHSSVSTWDGKIIPCCFDKDAQYQMGNIQNESFQTIWSNEKYREFRKRILKSRSEIDICQNCSEGTKVWESIS